MCDNNYTNNNNTNTNTYGFNLYYGNNPYNAFIDNKVDFYNNFTLSNSYNYNALNPYFKTNSNNNFAFNNVFKLNDTTTLNLGVLTQNYTINYDKYYYDNNNGNNSKKETEELGNALSFLAGLDYNVNNNLSTKLELGFINNKNDCVVLNSKIDLIVNAIVQGIVKEYDIKQKNGKYTVQLGVFNSKANAQALANELKSKGYDAIIKASV